MKSLTLAIPAKASLQGRFTLCLLQVLNQIQSRTGYKPYVRVLLGKSNIVHARSLLLTEWMDSSGKDDLFLFLDADQVFTIEDIEALVKKEGDVVSGLYVNGAGFPTCYPMNPKAFQKGQDDLLMYSGCGFMMIRRPILSKILPLLEKELGASRFAMSREEDKEGMVIPFFQTKALLTSELTPEATTGDWLGEDYSFCWRVRQAGGIIRAYLSKTLGHEIPQVCLLPEGYFPSESSSSSVSSLVYYCGNSVVKFCPTSKGLGGSEQAVVELSRAWARAGYSVTVYGNVYPGTYEGVSYKSVEEFDFQKHYSTLILWRSFGIAMLPLVKANTLLIDLHDLPRKELFPLDLLQEKRAILCVKSQFHRSLLPHLPEKAFFVQPNGIRIQEIQTYRPVLSTRDPNRFLWTSSYDRGLPEFLTHGWPLIRKRFPSAVLHLYYGMDLCPPEVQRKIRSCLNLFQGQVIDHGKVDQLEVTKARWASTYHVYITDFQEIDCLSIRESVAAGCLPIVANHAVFSERPALYVEREDSLSVWEQMDGLLAKLQSDRSVREKLQEALQKKLQDQGLAIDWASVAAAWSRVLMKQ